MLHNVIIIINNSMGFKKSNCSKAGCVNGSYKRSTKCKKHFVAENRNKTQVNNEGVLEKFCSKCAVFREESGFIGTDNKPTSRCAMCLATSRRAEQKRPERDRKEEFKQYEKRSERIEKRAEYKQENPEQFIKYYMDHRAKMLEKDPKAYHDRNNKVAREWRAKNPDYMEKQYAKDKLNADKKLYTYKFSAETKGIEWKLTNEEANKLYLQPCYYCNDKSDSCLNGIDRVDNSKPYEISNTVSSCKMCNYMKNTMDITTFIKRCIHIATYNEKFDGNLYTDVFADCKSAPYISYKRRAEHKQIKFNITIQYFANLIKKKCYICGHKSNYWNDNGVDRVDNNKGYTNDNIKSCCNCCNIMKKDYSLEQFLTKCTEIATISNMKLNEYNDINYANHMQPTNRIKSTVNRKANLQAEYQKKRNQLMNPEYRKQHAKELAARKS